MVVLLDRFFFRFFRVIVVRIEFVERALAGVEDSRSSDEPDRE